MTVDREAITEAHALWCDCEPAEGTHKAIIDGRCIALNEAIAARLETVEADLAKWTAKCDEVGVPHEPDTLVKHHRNNAQLIGAANAAADEWYSKCVQKRGATGDALGRASEWETVARQLADALNAIDFGYLSMEQVDDALAALTAFRALTEEISAPTVANDPARDS